MLISSLDDVRIPSSMKPIVVTQDLFAKGTDFPDIFCENPTVLAKECANYLQIRPFGADDIIKICNINRGGNNYAKVFHQIILAESVVNTPVLSYLLFKINFFSIEEIKNALLQYKNGVSSLYFAQHISDYLDFSKDFYFSIPKDYINELLDNNFLILNDFIQYGWKSSSIGYLIKYDLLSSDNSIPQDEIIEWSPFEWCKKPNNLSPLSIAALFGAVSSFRILLEHGHQICEDVCLSSICSANKTILKSCENFISQECLYNAALFRQRSLFDWILNFCDFGDLDTHKLLRCNYFRAFFFAFQNRASLDPIKSVELFLIMFLELIIRSIAYLCN